MIILWDVDSGLAQIDKYFHSNDNHVISGALLGVGIVNCGVKNDCDPVSFFSPPHLLVYAQNIMFAICLSYFLYLGTGASE